MSKYSNADFRTWMPVLPDERIQPSRIFPNRTTAHKIVSIPLALMLVLMVGLVAASYITPSYAAFPSENGKIVFVSERDTFPRSNGLAEADEEIYVMNADGSGENRLTNHQGRDSFPTWSPDGKRIAFDSEISGSIAVMIMNADGTDLKPLASGEMPDWSPDGKKLVFDAGGEIFTINIDGGNSTNLTNNGRFPADHGARWSPDGSKIAFISTRDGNEEIYVMNADGSHQTRLTNNTEIDELPN